MPCFATLIVAAAMALDNGVGITPPMGFNPWNCFGISSKGSCFNESVIMDVARAIAGSPLKEAGYSYVNLDCGYSTGFRGADGTLTVNTTRYPHGMKWLGDQIHDLGLKFGMYSDAGTQQCCSRFYGKGVNDGSLGHEKQDAALFASWGVDYLKHDSCGAQPSSYPDMRDALNSTGRRIYYSIHGPIGVPDIANTWRTTGDIDNTWESILSKVESNNQRRDSAQPGAFNDPDMLEVGNLFGPLGEAEGRSQFSMWAVMKSPLLIGTDVTNMTSATLATLTNPEVIAVNQDNLGRQAAIVPGHGHGHGHRHRHGHVAVSRKHTAPEPGLELAAALLNVVVAKCDGSRDQQWEFHPQHASASTSASASASTSASASAAAPVNSPAPVPTGELLTISQKSSGFLLNVFNCTTATHPGPGGNVTAVAAADVKNASSHGACGGRGALFSLNAGNKTITTGLDGQCVNLYGKPGSARYHYDVQTYRCAGDVQANDQWEVSPKGEVKSLATGGCLTTGPVAPPAPAPAPSPPPSSGPLLFVGELAGGARTVLLVNTAEAPASLTFDMRHINATSPSAQFEARDLWKRQDLPGSYGQGDVLNFTDIGGHDCVLLRLAPK